MWSKSYLLYLWYLAASALFLRVHAELFTAISDLEPLLETHKKFIDDLNHYIDKEEDRLKLLRKHLDVYKAEHVKAMEDIPNYLGNPINAFTLIKRLTTDLDCIEEIIKKGTDNEKDIIMNHPGVKYPTLEDLTGAAEALTRLQDTYHLQIRELAEGKLNGVIYSTPMSTSDCYEFGRTRYNENDYKNALLWMMEAHRKFEGENEPYPFTEGDILEHISFCHYLLGDTLTALEWTKKLLTIEPRHPRARGNIPLYQKKIAEDEEKLRNNRRGDVGEPESDAGEVDGQDNPVTWQVDVYEALCRGEIDIAADVSKRLKCRYLTENHPFLKLAPIKMEQMYIKPDIVLFHEVMSEEESEHIKELAKPKFRRATIHETLTGKLLPAQYRISKSSWLRDEDSPIVARVSRRIADFTGLSLDTAEQLQVVNYGIGGHYEPHFDFTIMSDVAQGGATVFTELGLSVFPVARAAAFWLNLHPSGEGDLATLHAACPVLRGSKWVCNKWIHEGGQELIKPCNLEYQKEGIIHQIPKPVPKSFT